MNTPAHLIFGLAAFGRPGRPRVTGAAALGALAPDLSLYLMVGVAVYGMGIAPRRVFGELYYSEAWQRVFAIDNSFVLWGVLLGVAIWRRSPVLVAFAGAATMHLAFDFPLHNHDARMHFWPVSDWVFVSPLSYWDDAFYGRVVGVLEVAVSLILAALLVLRFRSWAMRVGIGGLALAETFASGIWRFVF